MGAWGIGNLENDTALDWIYELEDSEDISLIQETIERVFDDEEIDSFVAEEALTAIEVLAALKGNMKRGNDSNEEIALWVKDHPINLPSALLAKARNALEFIASKNCELRDLWEETEDFEAWKKELDDLKSRLK